MAGGGIVGVGYGILRICPTLIGQVDGRLFSIIMLWTETPKLNASCEQDPSPSETLYSKGGWGVAVGMSVAGEVAVGGWLAVGVRLGVGDSAGASGSPLPPPPARSTKNIMAAATMITTAKIPTAAGRLSVTSGMRLACTDFCVFLTAFGPGCALNSVPHTRQRVAFSLRRVPQVGQTFVLLLEMGSWLIRAKIIPLNKNTFYNVIAQPSARESEPATKTPLLSRTMT